jgi:hypothetical protein
MIFYLLQSCAFTKTKPLAVNCVNTKVFILLDACLVIVSGIFTLCIPPHHTSIYPPSQPQWE